MSTYREDLENGDIPGALLHLQKSAATAAVMLKDSDTINAAHCLAIHDACAEIGEKISHTTLGNIQGAILPFTFKSQIRDLDDQLKEVTGISALDMQNAYGYTGSKEQIAEFSGDIGQQLELFGGDIKSTVQEYVDSPYTKYLYIALGVVVLLLVLKEV